MDAIGLSGYLLASAAYLGFVFLLIAARNNTIQGRVVLFASVVTFLCAAVSVAQIHYHLDLRLVLALEAFKIAAWALLIHSAKDKAEKLRHLLLQPHVRQYFIIWTALNTVFWSITFYLEGSYKYLFLLYLVLNLWLLVLLEQLFRNASAQVRWALWPLIIAIGGVAAFDFVLYAQAVMVAKLDFNFWYSRGFIAMIMMPLLLVSTRRMKDWSVNVFISRNVVFYSSMFLISGLYLLIMAFAGYIINYLGGRRVMKKSVAFWALGSSLLVALLITEKLRRRVKVFITKHFFANKYDYRLEWLKLIGQLEEDNEGNYYQKATEIIKSTLGIEQGAIVKKISTNNFKFVFNDGLVITDSLRQEFSKIECFIDEHPWIIDLSEYKTQPENYESLTLDIQIWQRTGARLVVPISMKKELYGFFVLSTPQSEALLNWEDRDLLFAIAKQLGNYVSLHEANSKIAESKQFDAFNRMSAFLVHDLKNVQAQLALINTNAKRHRDNPDFIDDVFETVESASSRLGKVLTQLRNKQVAQTENKLVDIEDLLTKVAAQRNVVTPQVELSVSSLPELNIDNETLHSVLNHLIQNAQEATNDAGWVKVKAQGTDDQLLIAISDNGCGMSEEFVAKRLFKPFDTTKGNAGMGIGVYEAKQFIEGMGGTIQVASFVGKGTTFNLSIPIVK